MSEVNKINLSDLDEADNNDPSFLTPKMEQLFRDLEKKDRKVKKNRKGNKDQAENPNVYQFKGPFVNTEEALADLEKDAVEQPHYNKTKHKEATMQDQENNVNDKVDDTAKQSEEIVEDVSKAYEKMAEEVFENVKAGVDAEMADRRTTLMDNVKTAGMVVAGIAVAAAAIYGAIVFSKK